MNEFFSGEGKAPKDYILSSGDVIRSGELGELSAVVKNDGTVGVMFFVGSRRVFLTYETKDDFYDTWGIDCFEKQKFVTPSRALSCSDEANLSLTERLMKVSLDESLKGITLPRDKALSVYNEIREVMVYMGVRDSYIVYGGSIRRGKPTVGDLDIAVFDASLDKGFYLNLLNKLEALGHRVDSRTVGESQTSFSLDGFLVEIKKAPFESWATMMLFITGSGDFNVAMRAYAKSKGYRLNQYFLTDSYGVKVKVPTEYDIFDVLGLHYVPPEERTGPEAVKVKKVEAFKDEGMEKVLSRVPGEIRREFERFVLPQRDELGIVIPRDLPYNPESRHAYYRRGGRYRLPDKFKLDKYFGFTG